MVSEEIIKDIESIKCNKCGDTGSIEILEKVDLIDYYSDLADKTSANVEIISPGSAEGDSLYSAFNGVAGILRYPLDL